MLSLRARLLRRGFAVMVGALRTLRGGLPGADDPPERLEAYAVRARAQLEGIARRIRLPRSATLVPADDAPVRSLVVVDAAARGGRDAEVARDEVFAGTERVVLYLHGGAYCLGSPELHRGLAATVSRTARAPVVLPDYRLAPEHPFPAALDDVTATWDWLIHDRGIDPSRVAVAGDSAGAGLAAALCLRLRDEGRPTPACLVGLSPWMDLAATGGSLVDNEAVDLWVPAHLVLTAARAYAGTRPLDDPFVSPLYGDLSGLPPTLVHVGTHEVLLDDAVRFVAAARERGVDASLGRFDGLWHVFHAFRGFPESRSALQEVGAFIRRHTAARLLAARPAAG